MRTDDLRSGRTRDSAEGGPFAICEGAAAELPVTGRMAPARMVQLVRTVEAEIVPRLVVARSGSARKALASPGTDRRIDESELEEFARLLVVHEVEVASAFVDTIRDRGVSIQDVCLGLLAPAARRLGVMWERDECTFMQVTVGLCHLHQLLHRLHSMRRIPADDAAREKSRNALLVAVPGEQHTFGLVMVGHSFRQAGWEVCHEFPRTDDELVTLVEDGWYAMVGLSLGSESRLDGVVSLIRALRGASSNPRLFVMLGGPMLLNRPELAGELGADATATDGEQAAAIASAAALRLSAASSVDPNLA